MKPCTVLVLLLLRWCALYNQSMSGGGGGGEGGGVLNLSNVEEGRGTEQPESATRREPIANEVVAAGTRVLGACMFGLPWRRIVASLAYMTTMLCVISLVRSSAHEFLGS